MRCGGNDGGPPGMGGTSPAGFTLVELIVAVSIIAGLMSLLVPAVQQSREAARKASCASNLRQIGLAIQLYHDANGTLPFAHVYADGKKGQFLQQSWTKQLLPYIEQAPLFQSWDSCLGYAQGENRDRISVGLSLYKCPSSPAPLVAGFNLMGFPAADATDPAGWDYDAGVAEYFAVSNFVGPSPKGVPSGIGMFPYPMPPTRTRPVRFSEIRDGLTSTIAVGELAGGADVYRAKSRTGEAQLPALGHWAARNRLELMRYNAAGDRRGTGECLVNCTNYNGSNFYGFHPGGVQVLLGDGSCRFLTDRVTVEVVARLCVIADGQVNTEF